MNGFKLQWDSERGSASSVVASSLMCKRRIDSMFDDTRSLASASSPNRNSYDPAGYVRKSCAPSNAKIASFLESRITNEVQNKIDRMFQEIGKPDIDPISDVNKFQTFSVAYMGSITLQDKVTSLRQLQLPLKSLYLDYLKFGRSTYSMQGSLQINDNGLKVTKFENELNRSLQTLVYPFAWIAVWAAVKFVYRKKELTLDGKDQNEYAFMPLIADPDSANKIPLFHNLSETESDIMLQGEAYYNPPLFTVVTRESGLTDNFDCHSFICSSSNDAIILAANLYTALVQSIPSLENKYCELQDHPAKHRRRSLVCKGNTCTSTVSSQLNCSDMFQVQESSNKLSRKKKLHHSSNDTCSEEILKSQTLSNPKNKLNRKYAVSLDEINNITKMSSKEAFYEIETGGVSSQQMPLGVSRCEWDGGDILTKVAIPRSKSFLNTSGPFFSRYTKGTEGSSYSSNKKKADVVSPLGLNELFQEFKQEGLYSMNEILDAIIDSDGMSFNDLKPIYKEFVLKLALTLTKDELYQRSKSIMQKQKHKKRQSDRRHNPKKPFISGNVLKKVLKSSITNLKYSKYKRNSLEFTSVFFSSSQSDCPRKTSSTFDHKVVPVSVVSSVSNREKRSMRKHKKNVSSNRTKSSSRKNKDCKFTRSIQDRKANGSNRDINCKKKYFYNWSSGYISCSDCSYSSGSCTRSLNEKCYCSSNTKRSEGNFRSDSEPEISPCECDTDSCFESDKCYCNRSSLLRTTSGKSISIYDLITLNKSASRNMDGQQIGFSSKTKTPGTTMNSGRLEAINIGRLSKSDHQIFAKSKGTVDSVGTSSSMKIASNIDLHIKKSSISLSCQKSKKIEVKDANSNMSNQETFKSNQTKNEEKVLMISARDPCGKLIYRGQTREDANRRETPNKTNATMDALCVKKTAEIAALFSCSNESIIYNTLEPSDHFKPKYTKSGFVETNLESSLGYLP